MSKQRKSARRGRPRGSKTRYTIEGESQGANLRKAVFGPLDGKPGAAFADQLWVAANPTTGTTAEQDNAFGAADGAKMRQEQAEAFADVFGRECLRRVQLKDALFFQHAAATIAMRVAESIPNDPVRAALLAFTTVEQSTLANRKFTLDELRTRVRWPKKAGGCPGDRQLKRLIVELGIPT